MNCVDSLLFIYFVGEASSIIHKKGTTHGNNAKSYKTPHTLTQKHTKHKKKTHKKTKKHTKKTRTKNTKTHKKNTHKKHKTHKKNTHKKHKNTQKDTHNAISLFLEHVWRMATEGGEEEGSGDDTDPLKLKILAFMNGSTLTT